MYDDRSPKELEAILRRSTGSSAGRLDALGRASASITIPPAARARLSGLTFYHSVVLLGSGVSAANNSVPP